MNGFSKYPDSFEGGAFYHGFEGGKSTGCIQVARDSISFHSETEHAEFPIDNLEVSLGGPGDRSVFIRHPSHPDWSIFTEDKRILQHSVFLRNRNIENQLGKIRARKLNIYVILVTLPIVLCLLIYGLFLLKEPAVKYLTSKIPIEWEEKLGEAIFSQLSLGNTFITDPKIEALLAHITDPLIGAIPDSKYKIKFHIIASPTINAFAIPGGHIVIHSELLRAADTAEEIAGVLAHELSHITLQHSLRQLVGTAGLYLTAQAIFGDLSGLLATIADNSTFLLTQKFSRDYEREADDQGWVYLLKANINPEGMIEFFQKLKKQQEKTATGISTELEDSFAFFSTHPTTDERIERLRKKAAKLDKKNTFTPLDLELDELKKLLKK